MMVLKRRWLRQAAEVRSKVDYCVYVDVADSFLIVIIKLHRQSNYLSYLQSQPHLALSVR